MDFHGGGAAAVIVVEYLESSMSRGLLCKFPDNSSFDFDYAQSSIWSPLVPRTLPSLGSRLDLSCGLSRKLFCGGGAAADRLFDNGNTTNFKYVTSNIKRKLNAAVYDKYQKIKKNNKANAAIEYSPMPAPSTSQTPRKGWGNLLKAASKQFKKNKNKKRDSTRAHISHSNLFTNWDF